MRAQLVALNIKLALFQPVRRVEELLTRHLGRIGRPSAQGVVLAEGQLVLEVASGRYLGPQNCASEENEPMAPEGRMSSDIGVDWRALLSERSLQREQSK